MAVQLPGWPIGHGARAPAGRAYGRAVPGRIARGLVPAAGATGRGFQRAVRVVEHGMIDAHAMAGEDRLKLGAASAQLGARVLIGVLAEPVKND